MCACQFFFSFKFIQTKFTQINAAPYLTMRTKPFEIIVAALIQAYSFDEKRG